jgi:hypothetical protein
MAITDIDTAMQGIGTNPAMIIRAPDFVANGTEIVYNTEYFEGKAVRGTYGGQKLFETGWIPKGVFTGNYTPLLFFSDGGGTALVDAFDRVKVLVYRRIDKTTAPELYRITNLSFMFVDGFSNASGTNPYDNKTNIVGNRYYYFNKEYEYKFVAYVDVLTVGGVIDVEAIKFQQITSGSWQNAYQGGAAVVTDEGPESVDVLDTWVWTATADGGTGSANTGRVRAVLPVTVFDMDGTSSSYGRSITYGTGFTGYYSDYGFRSNFADIEGAVTEMFGGTQTSNMTWLTSKYNLTDLGVYTVEFYGTGFVNSGQIYMSTTVFGAQFPVEV